MGNATQFTYEGEQLKSLTNPDGKKITFVYDQNDNILAIADFSGSAYLTNEYDESKRITAQTLMGRGSSFVSYNEENSTVTFTDELENKTVYTYDASHNITAIALGDSCIHNSYNVDGCNSLIQDFALCCKVRKKVQWLRCIKPRYVGLTPRSGFACLDSLQLGKVEL